MKIVIFTLVLLAPSPLYPCFAPLTCVRKIIDHGATCPCLNLDNMQRIIDHHHEKIIDFINKKIHTESDMLKPLPITGFHAPAIFSLAYNNKNKDLIALLLKKRPKLTNLVEPETGNTIFHTAAEQGTNKILAKLLIYAKESNIPLNILEKENNNKQTPLMLAAYYSRTKCVKDLLSHGASINSPPSPLHRAAVGFFRSENKQNTIILMLCQAGANLDTKNEDDLQANEQQNCSANAKNLIAEYRSYRDYKKLQALDLPPKKSRFSRLPLEIQCLIKEYVIGKKYKPDEWQKHRFDSLLSSDISLSAKLIATLNSLEEKK